MGAPVAPGLVLATNYLFMDEAVLGFWNRLHGALGEHGLGLVMLSTTEVRGAEFSLVPIPYHLAGFAERFPQRAAASARARVPSWAEPLARGASAWDPTTPAEATAAGLAPALDFYGDLLRALEPTAVLAWNGLHPHTQLLLGLARLNGIPAYAGERGWLPGTMMFDLGENSLLTEWSQSMALQSVLEDRTEDPALYGALRDHVLARRAGKYRTKPMLEPAPARAEFGLPADRPVWAVFTHAEPGIHAPAGGTRPWTHAASAELLDELLVETAIYTRHHGIALLIQEHPINREIGVKRAIAGDANVRFTEGNIHTLLGLADVTLHTASTVQLDAVFYERPIVLLGRSLLSPAAYGGEPAAYERPDFPNFVECLDAARAASGWPRRHTALARWITTLARRQLIDIDTGLVPHGAGDFARVLGRFARPAPADLGARVGAFNARWIWKS